MSLKSVGSACAITAVYPIDEILLNFSMCMVLELVPCQGLKELTPKLLTITYRSFVINNRTIYILQFVTFLVGSRTMMLSACCHVYRFENCEPCVVACQAQANYGIYQNSFLHAILCQFCMLVNTFSVVGRGCILRWSKRYSS